MTLSTSEAAVTCPENGPAATSEFYSEHPLARALTAEASLRVVPLIAVANSQQCAKIVVTFSVVLHTSDRLH